MTKAFQHSGFAIYRVPKKQVSSSAPAPHISVYKRLRLASATLGHQAVYSPYCLRPTNSIQEQLMRYSVSSTPRFHTRNCVFIIYIVVTRFVQRRHKRKASNVVGGATKTATKGASHKTPTGERDGDQGKQCECGC